MSRRHVHPAAVLRRASAIIFPAWIALAATFSLALSTIDGLGWIKQHVNDLGTFVTAYTGNDPRPDSVTRGSFQTLYDYLPSGQGGFLDQIHNKHGTTTVSKFDYTYTPDGKIDTWTKEQGGTVKFMAFVHDLAGQLTKATTRQNNGSGAVLETLGFGYDRAGNRVAKIVDGDPFTANFNSRNQLTTGDFLGEVPFVGEMDEWAEVEITADGETKRARVREHGFKWLFEAKVPLESDGMTQVDVNATDASSNVTSNSYRIDSGSGQWASLSHDDNGNTTSRTIDSTTTTYTWDRENRLETVTVGGVTERLIYNALGERVKIIRDPGGAGEVERRFTWTGGCQPSQERDSTNQVIANFHGEGGQRWDGSGFDDYFYARDHLGSVREMMDDTGTVVARYDYSPYGIREAIGTPTVEATFGFTGHFHHELTGHVLTYYRAYDPELGRWLSADPLGEQEGVNLYGYVYNDPAHLWDPDGRAVWLAIPVIIGWIATTENAHAPADFEETQNVGPPPIAVAAQVAFPPGAGLVDDCAKAVGKKAAEQLGKEAVKQLGRKFITEGDPVIAVVGRDGSILAEASAIGMSHADLIARQLGGKLPEEAVAVTVGKFDGQIDALLSRGIHQGQGVAPQWVQEAVRKCSN